MDASFDDFSPSYFVRGRWTEEEHEAFEAGLHRYGTNWKRVQEFVPTRTLIQIRTHAQKCAARARGALRRRAHCPARAPLLTAPRAPLRPLPRASLP